jgi:hypothetical protein
VPSGHPERASFALTYADAEFLAERLRCERRTKGSMLATLTSVPGDHEAVGYAWEHPSLAALSDEQRDVVEQGRRFSLLMHGAAWIYNVILTAMDERAEAEAGHRAHFETWAARLATYGDALDTWDLRELWEAAGLAKVTVPPRTRLFVTEWLTAVREHEPTALVDRADVRDLIIQREQRMKGRNARTTNDRALKQWGGSSGTTPLDYRWSTARLLINDIRAGLERTDAAY